MDFTQSLSIQGGWFNITVKLVPHSANIAAENAERRSLLVLKERKKWRAFTQNSLASLCMSFLLPFFSLSILILDLLFISFNAGMELMEVGSPALAPKISTGRYKLSFNTSFSHTNLLTLSPCLLNYIHTKILWHPEAIVSVAMNKEEMWYNVSWIL